MASLNDIPNDLLIDAADEIRIRQDLVLTALGRRPADRALRVGRLLDVHSRSWSEDQEIVFKGRRIAWVGPAGSYQVRSASACAGRISRPFPGSARCTSISKART